MSASEEKDKGLPSDCQWIAYELHDGLLQWVVGARMEVESALSRLEDQVPRAAEKLSLEHASLYLRTALAEARAMIGYLEQIEENTSPNLNLCDRIHQFVNLVQEQLLQNEQELIVNIDPQSLPPLTFRQAWSVYRIVQQSVRNAMQHAGPTQITITVERLKEQQPRPCIVSVADCGKGFDVSQADKPEHFGLSSMRRRAKLLRGELQIISAPHAGCKVSLILPADLS